MLPGARTPEGVLYIVNGAAGPADTRSGGVLVTPEGSIHVNGNAPQKFDQGKGFSNTGDLSVDLLGEPIFGYVGGLPVTANGALKCQLNQTPAAKDPFVGNIRVGPLGGVYVTDAVPGGGGAFSPSSLFASGELGCWYDPSDLSTMFQSVETSSPVTAVGQSIGLILDNSKGLALGPQIVVTPDFSSSVGWGVLNGTTISGGTANISQVATNSVLDVLTAGGGALSLTLGAVYKISYEVKSFVSGAARWTNASTNVTPQRNANGTYADYLVCDRVDFLRLQCIGASQFSIDNVTVNLVQGNHAKQATASARPVLANNANTKKFRDFDAVDDSMSTTFTSSLGSTCTVGRANATTGAQILTGQTIGTTYAANTDDCALVITNDALTTQETTDLTAWLNAKAGF